MLKKMGAKASKQLPDALRQPGAAPIRARTRGDEDRNVPGLKCGGKCGAARECGRSKARGQQSGPGSDSFGADPG